MDEHEEDVTQCAKYQADHRQDFDGQNIGFSLRPFQGNPGQNYPDYEQKYAL